MLNLIQHLAGGAWTLNQVQGDVDSTAIVLFSRREVASLAETHRIPVECNMEDYRDAPPDRE